MAKHAFVLRRITDAGERKTWPAGAVILDLTEGQFANYGRRVREATDKEVAEARVGNVPAALDTAPGHPRGLVQPPPPPAPPKRVRKPRARKAQAKGATAKRTSATKKN